ncbi:MAG TPA: 2-oxoglutarate dehydrogenase complex dihydrolipoyllysine-residue succinyltransferase [Chloroflexota bacterium]|nr:2-oxoglutarate dehydrogenase complex dihydrolipoyllysine-residue succinyltransferase [Chloroflexota bacterium]
MPVEIRVPPLGESLVEATVGRWLRHEGDTVTEGETVVELETEKVNLEVPAPASGVLAKILQPEGATVKVGEGLGTITPAAARAATVGPRAPETTPSPAPVAEATPRGAEPRPVSPVARRMAEEYGVNLSGITGTGPGGRITRSDVEEAVAQQTVISAPPPTAPPSRPLENVPLPTEVAVPARVERPEERIRLSRRRLTIARRLVEAQHEAALLTTFNEIDMSAVMDLRKRRREAFQTRHGIGLGFMSFFTKAAVAALKAFPRVNAEMQGDELILKYYYDIGIAVDTEGGLVVPVVRDADRKSFAEIEQTISELAKRARANELTLEDLRGGTFTITNGGIFGSLLSTPIVNPPQVAILGMHRIQERPIAVNGEVAIHPMMYVALTYDHRVIDGREAVQFLVRIKELIEDPEALLLES